MASDMFSYQGGWAEKQGMQLMSQAAHNMESIKEVDVKAIGGFYSNFVKITDFDTDPENTYYREREWRCIGNFNFEISDIEAVVAPAAQLSFIRVALAKLGAREVNSVSWEFIEQA